MGWCSGTRVFDSVADAVLGANPKSTEDLLEALVVALEDMDWDCQNESDYWDHPIVSAIFKRLHPEWFEDEDE